MNGHNLDKASLALNVVLLGIVIVMTTHHPKAASPSPAIPTFHSLSAVASPVHENPAAVYTPPLKSYSTLASTDDWRQWIDQLRKAGVPNATLARLVQADFDDHWQKKLAEAQSEYARGDINSDDLAKLDIERQIEQKKELRAALGKDGFKSWDEHRLLGELNLKNVDLTGTESNALYTLKMNLEQRLQDLNQQKLNGDIDLAELTSQQEAAQTNFDQQAETLLGDDRYATMQGQANPPGDMRRALQNISVSDDQFAEMMEIQSNWNSSRMQLEEEKSQTQDVSIDKQLLALEDTRDTNYEQILGIDGFALFQKQQDSRYTDMQRYENTWGINDADINYIYKTIQYYDQSVQDYRQQESTLQTQGQIVNWDTVTKNIQTFSREMEKNLQDYLGDDRFNIIKKNEIINF